ncbi:hypothetical protein Dimus_026784, partial [Dionaea muscipula]
MLPSRALDVWSLGLSLDAAERLQIWDRVLGSAWLVFNLRRLRAFVLDPPDSQVAHMEFTGEIRRAYWLVVGKAALDLSLEDTRVAYDDVLTPNSLSWISSVIL